MWISRLLASEYGRLVADALKDSVAELRKDEEARVAELREGEEARVSKCAHAGPSQWRTLTRRSHRITDAFSKEISKLLEGEENRVVRLVFPRAFDGARSDQINLILLQVGRGNCKVETRKDQD